MIPFKQIHSLKKLSLFLCHFRSVFENKKPVRYNKTIARMPKNAHHFHFLSA